MLQYAVATAMRSVILWSATMRLYIISTFGCETAKTGTLWWVNDHIEKRGFTLSQTLKRMYCNYDANYKLTPVKHV
jgi:hypothetical protein